MSKAILGTLGAIIFGAFAWVVVSLDDSPRPTPEQDDAAYAEWHEMDPYAREIVCDMLEVNPERFIPEDGYAQAKLDLMERECK